MAALEESLSGAGDARGGLPSAHRHPHPDLAIREELSMGHHGRRLHRRLFRHPHEVRRDLRDASTTARSPRRNTARGPACYCGLILLTSTETGEPLAFINDGHLQHMRVGADGGIGVKYLAKRGCRGRRHARLRRHGAHAHARVHARPQHQEAASVQPDARKPRTVRPRDGADLQYRGRGLRPPEDVYKGADIVAGLTDSAVPVIDGTRARKGRAHRQCRRQRQAGRRKPAARRCLSALRRHAGADRPA